MNERDNNHGEELLQPIDTDNEGTIGIDIFNLQRRNASVTTVGNVAMGGNNPVRVQSMTTTNTNDTEASVAQVQRIVQAGGELVRLTTQGKREAENLQNIKQTLSKLGLHTPLVADVHFNANVADVAAQHVEKVRINPGNYVDPGRTFKQLEYTDEEYAEEIKKIDARFVPFLNICRQNNTAVRIGVNHGSLSDRIMSRYGDTPAGIVESCMEFLRICKREQFNNVVISIKASNTVVMVQSVRLLVQQMRLENMNYPLHLGVTEAGEGEDGRIKSAVGIGALLADGIGDTIRVSLSEEPEAEIPVARALVDYVSARTPHLPIPAKVANGFNFVAPERRSTNPVANIGGQNPPVVISNRMDKNKVHVVTNIDQTPDYIYIGRHLPATLSPQRRYIMDYDAYMQLASTNPQVVEQVYPIFPHNAVPFISLVQADVKFLVLQYGADSEEYIACLKHHPEVVVVCMSTHKNKVGDQRALVHELWQAGLNNPVVFAQMYRHTNEEKDLFQLKAAADMGPLMIDGLTDGIWLMNDGDISDEDVDATAFGILQAARLRTTKTEYISCPGCGRTLYDLRSTIARIREATKHMKGLKIGIMGCIVNGPGEMADADFGYVGAGPGKVSLYRKKECVEKNIDEKDAVEHLLRLIENSLTPNPSPRGEGRD